MNFPRCFVYAIQFKAACAYCGGFLRRTLTQCDAHYLFSFRRRSKGSESWAQDRVTIRPIPFQASTFVFALNARIVPLVNGFAYQSCRRERKAERHAICCLN
jgi:hypothetical protein